MKAKKDTGLMSAQQQRVYRTYPVQFPAEAKHTNDHCCQSLQQRDEHLVKDQKTKLQGEKNQTGYFSIQTFTQVI